MAKDYSRVDRVEDFLQRELAQTIQREMRDPRVSMVSVNAVKASRDLAHAKIYITQLGASGAKETKECLLALNRAAGFLRSQLARMSTMRTIPSLKFVYDESVQRGTHLSHLIDQAVEEDRHRGDDEAEEV